jgi:hypothetical protein
MLKSLLLSTLLLQNILAQAPGAQSPPAGTAPNSVPAVAPAASPPAASSPAVAPVGAPKLEPPPAGSSVAPAVSSPAAPVGAPKLGPPPAGSSAAPAAPAATPVCKVIAGDKNWPADDVWTKEIPGVQKSPEISGTTTRPDWVINAKEATDVQAAVNFAAKYNVRVSIINSGHDFLGR